VTEGDAFRPGLQHAELDAFGQPLQCAAQHALEHGGIDAAADHRRGIDHTARRRGETADARQHGIADRRRQPVLAVRQDLADEEGIARGAPVQFRGIDRPTRRQIAHGLDRQARQLDAQRLGRGEIAQQHAHRGLRRDLIGAAGQDQQDTAALEPAAEELHQIERRLVGPVDVLDDQQRRLAPLAELVQQAGKQRRARRFAFELGQELAPQLARDVIERAERRRREQGIAMALENAQAGRLRPHEPFDEGGLADAGLAAHQGDAAFAGARTVQGCRQHLHGLVAFEQLHGHFQARRTGKNDNILLELQ
jgi:hypothetical protein